MMDFLNFAAKLVQNERIAKFYMDFSELQPNFINEIDKGTKKLLILIS